MCCPIDNADACGVCGGLNNTCATTIHLLVVVDPTADGDVKSSVRNFITTTLTYPVALVSIGEIEAMDVTEVLTYVGMLPGYSDADAYADDSQDFVFGHVCSRTWISVSGT